MKKKRVLPIGIQSFEKVRKSGFVYIDKTRYIHELASNAGAYFLARPRRFGKSLLLSTMDAYFSGKKELFQGLEIEKLETEAPTDLSGEAWTASPVIRLDFNAGVYDSVESLEQRLSEMLASYEEVWGRSESIRTLPGRFAELIKTMRNKTGHGTVVLVDEYDKPLLSSMFSRKLNEELRSVLKGFFGALKSSDENLRFVFITGVTKFSHVSIFSDLNQLRDISLLPEYNGICGLTMEEIRSNLSPETEGLARSQGVTVEEACDQLAEWYDGYHFSIGGDGIFNPFSILNALADRTFREYWFQSGTPTFIVETLKRTGYDIRLLEKGIRQQEAGFADYFADIRSPLPLLYQSGYLTIKGYDRMLQRYDLALPNKEVKYGLYRFMLPEYAGIDADTGFTVEDFVQSVVSGDVAGFMKRLQALLSSIPYDSSGRTEKAHSYEYAYQIAVFLIFTLCGQYIHAEVHTLNGRSDAVCETDDHVYIFEFKMESNGTAADALKQIDDGHYADPYAASGRKITKIGVVFSEKARTIVDYKTA